MTDSNSNNGSKISLAAKTVAASASTPDPSLACPSHGDSAALDAATNRPTQLLPSESNVVGGKGLEKPALGHSLSSLSKLGGRPILGGAPVASHKLMPALERPNCAVYSGIKLAAGSFGTRIFS